MSCTEVYSPREIARAAGVDEERVRALLGDADGFVPYSDALRLARALMAAATGGAESSLTFVAPRPALFSLFGPAGQRARPTRVPLAVSGTLHAGFVALAVFVASLGLSPTAKTLPIPEERPPDMRLRRSLAAAAACSRRAAST